jgi:hypothetical protein
MYDMLTGLSKYQLGISTINTPNLSAMTTKSTETGKWSLNSSKTGVNGEAGKNQHQINSDTSLSHNHRR